MKRIIYLAVSSMLFWELPSCVDQLSLENRSCPCVDGWKCCEGSGICMPQELSCKEAPCTPGCHHGEYCYLQSCQECDDNRHCGPDCVDCNSLQSDWACLGDHCGCRDDRDCPGHLNCIEGVCLSFSAQQDGGTDDGGSDDGGDGSVKCGYNSKGCGQDCKDCTENQFNWTCVDGQCGCLGANDCPPDMACLSSRCVSGYDGGVDGDD